jgi:hypothetical protein
MGNGPGALEFDTTLQRKFQLTEKVAFNLRATAYNLANHPIFSNPSGTSSSSSFGRITSIVNDGATGSGAPRRIEFMLRTDF